MEGKYEPSRHRARFVKVDLIKQRASLLGPSKANWLSTTTITTTQLYRTLAHDVNSSAPSSRLFSLVRETLFKPLQRVIPSCTRDTMREESVRLCRTCCGTARILNERWYRTLSSISHQHYTLTHQYCVSRKKEETKN